MQFSQACDIGNTQNYENVHYLALAASSPTAAAPYIGLLNCCLK
jgi:hypothetical protein